MRTPSAHASRSFTCPYLPCGRTQLVPTTRARSSVVHAATILPRPAASVFKAPVLLLRRRVHVSSASPFELLGLPCSATPASRSTAARSTYRRKALQLHPDLHPGDAAALAHFRLLPDARRRALGMARTGTCPGFASGPGFRPLTRMRTGWVAPGAGVQSGRHPRLGREAKTKSGAGGGFRPRVAGPRLGR